MDKIKLKISEEAYAYLLNTLNSADEYSFIRLKKLGTCGSCSKIDIILDNYEEGDIKDAVEQLPFLYSEQLITEVAQIIMVYRNNSLMLKAVKHQNETNVCTHNCTACSSKCTK